MDCGDSSHSDQYNSCILGIIHISIVAISVSINIVACISWQLQKCMASILDTRAF